MNTPVMFGQYPNITGEFASSDIYSNAGNGTLAFKTTSRTISGNVKSGSNNNFLITAFNASVSEGMYGRSKNNQPAALQTLIIIKV